MDTVKIAKFLGVGEKDLKEVFKYIENYWPKLTRVHKNDIRSLIGLPNAYVVPTDGEVFQEQYYWDSYPVVRALIDDPKRWQLAVGMVENLLFMVKRFGIVPNASKMYFLSRSQPPVLSTLVWLVYTKTKDKKWFGDAIGLVEEEYRDVWMGKIHLRNFRNVHRGLSRYYDLNALDVLAEAESGWDMTARFMGKCLDFLPVDLNCLLYKYEADLEKAYEILGNPKKSERYKKLKSKRVKVMNELMWDGETGYFYDYNFVKKQRSHLVTIAGTFPLSVGIATKSQAQKMEKVVEKTLQKKYGLVQGVRFVENMQWDWPNGWAPMQMFAVDGLLEYGYAHLAQRIMKKWLMVNIKVFKETGFLWEKYDVVHGHIGVPDRYPTQPGFAWTNAVFLIFARQIADFS